MKNILITLILLTLTACNTIKKDELQMLVDKKQHEYYIDSLKECDDFPILKGKTMSDMYSFIINEASKQYYICANNNKKHIEYIKLMSNGK